MIWGNLRLPLCRNADSEPRDWRNPGAIHRFPKLVISSSPPKPAVIDISIGYLDIAVPRTGYTGKFATHPMARCKKEGRLGRDGKGQGIVHTQERTSIAHDGGELCKEYWEAADRRASVLRRCAHGSAGGAPAPSRVRLRPTPGSFAEG